MVLRKREHHTIRYWKKVIFTDESYLCAKGFRVDKVWRRDGEVLGPEYDLEIKNPKTEIKVLVWGAICYEGPLWLEIIDGMVNSQVY